MSTLVTGQNTRQDAHPDPSDGLNRRSAVRRGKQKHDGVKVGPTFFGWLTATGTVVMLTAFLAAATIAVSLATHTDAGSATTQATQDSKTVDVVGAIVLWVVLFVAYYCGGYVAGRMARFSGLWHGLAVWLWAVVTASVVMVLAGLAASRYDVLNRLNDFPRIPLSQGNLATDGLIALAVIATGSLTGALVGGLVGVHVHRMVDKARF